MNPKKVTAAALLFVLLVVGYVFYVTMQSKALEVRVKAAFGDARDNLAQNTAEEETRLLERYGRILIDCPRRGEYDSFLDRDNRTLSETELDSALALHDECGDYYYSRDLVSYESLEQRLLTLGHLSSVLGDSSHRTHVQITELWNQIVRLEKERIDLFGGNIDTQKEYWQADLEKAQGEITFDERELQVGALNDIARKNNARRAEIISELKQLKQAENALWMKYKE